MEVTNDLYICFWGNGNATHITEDFFLIEAKDILHFTNSLKLRIGNSLRENPVPPVLNQKTEAQ